MITPENMDVYVTNEYRNKVAARLKTLRKRYAIKYTQKDIANLLDVERQRISKLENGKVDANIKELICYSKLFGCEIEYLLYGDEPEYQKFYSFSNYPGSNLEYEEESCHRPEL